MSAGGKLEFGSIEWADDQPDIHSRAQAALGQRWAIVEYEAGAAREAWCTDGHHGYVLAGRIGGVGEGQVSRRTGCRNGPRDR